MLINWDQIYTALGVRDFIYFISSPSIQAELLPAKIVFIFFTVFFLCAIMWFYVNSSYIQYHYSQNVDDFLSWKPYGMRQINRHWDNIMKRTDSGIEAEYKLALIEADDLLYQVLEDKGYAGETFEELLDNAGKKVLPSVQEILDAHQIRNNIVYNPDYKLDMENAKVLLSNYESSIKNV